jgi:hypothetical protein
MSVNIVYTTSAIAVGGRDGITGTTDGKFEVKVARPIELGGKAMGIIPNSFSPRAMRPAFSAPCSSKPRGAVPRFRQMPK